MSLDTKYRPHGFSDVIGQVDIITILRQYILTGAGRRQSYLFAGPFGSGKTTLGRILARALMCQEPTKQGDPCNVCESCVSFLTQGNSLDFTEVDAATNSGKDEVKKITEEIEYATFSGRRRVYLFDEAHQLSPGALDALLKPMEENAPGSPDKKMVCIFCTTEPEKMRRTILSRCAPAFIIQPVPPEDIAKRLVYICEQEEFDHDPDCLQTIAEVTECHIRDALKAIEGIALLGKIDRDNTNKYLYLDLNDAFLDVFDALGVDLKASLEATHKILTRMAPASCYEKFGDVAMLAFQMALGVRKPPKYWPVDRLQHIADLHQNHILAFSARFASRPGRPTASMLLCDISQLHNERASNSVVYPSDVKVVRVAAPGGVASSGPTQGGGEVGQEISAPISTSAATNVKTDVNSSGGDGKLSTPHNQVTDCGVYVDERAMLRADETPAKESAKPELSVPLFCQLLGLRVVELFGERLGSSGHTNLGRHRDYPSG